MDLVEALRLNPNESKVVVAFEDAAEYESLIKSLVDYREEKGLTKAHVAEALHTTEQAISEMERLAGNPSVHQLMEYARAIGLRLQLQTTQSVPVSEN